MVDEDPAGLDPGQIQETREVIRSFGENNAVLISTHILPEVTLICKRVAIINNGRIVLSGDVRDLKHESPHRVLELELDSDRSSVLAATARRGA